jgi:hypothetical protein
MPRFMHAPCKSDTGDGMSDRLRSEKRHESDKDAHFWAVVQSPGIVSIRVLHDSFH